MTHLASGSSTDAVTWREPTVVDGIHFQRATVKTHLVQVKESLDDLVQRYVVPVAQPGDFIALSEKVVGITQGRVIHRSLVRPGLLAKLLVRGVKKWKNDVGYEDPAKMQVAIQQAGWLRMVAAMVGGGITRMFGRHGDFYRIAGHRISEIDGFNPDTITPYDEFAMLGPEDPPRDAQAVEDATGIPTLIVDANNINVKVLGMSSGLPVSAPQARLILLDNLMGQSDERTPIVLVRPAAPPG